MASPQSNRAPNKQALPSVCRQANVERVFCQFLTASEYPDWDRLVDLSPHGTVFHYSWWLAQTSEAFRLLVAKNEAGQILGGIPLPEKRRAGLRLLHTPPLTPYLGPIFDLYGTDGVCDQLHRMRSAGEAIAGSLGDFDSFRYMAGAVAPDLQGFLWADFSVSLAYTFRFSARQGIPEISRGITRTHMQKLTKAKKLNLEVVKDQSIEALLSLNKMTFERKETQRPFDDSLPLNLWREASQRQRANLYIAYTSDAQAVAGLLTVHDSRTTYQIISGFDPAFLDIPGQNLLLWTAVQDTLAAGRDFDFEGSGLKGVEAFYRRWGATAVPVWRIEKTGSLLGILANFTQRYRQAIVQKCPRIN